jgi:hypothetical protein
MYYGTPPIITAGLVYNLDALNSLCINQVPTVNQYTNPEFTNNTGSWQFASWSSLIYTYQVVYAPGPNGNIAPLLKVTRISGSAGSAHFHQGNGGKYTTNGRYTLSAFVSGSGSFTGRHQTLGTIGTYTLTNTWQRVEYTFTQPNDTQYPFWAGDAIAVSESLYFTLAQSERLPYASPYVSGSRLTATSLSTSASSATFFSASVTASIPTFTRRNDRVLDFDGTGSYATINSPWSYLSSSATEVFFSANSFGSSFNTPLAGYDQSDTGTFSFSVAGMVYITNSDRKIRSSVITTTQVYREVASTTVIQPRSYYHVVLNKDTTNGILQLYINGILEATNTFDTSSYAQWPTLGTFRGSNIIQLSSTLSANTSFDSKYLNGTIPTFRLYNRILSQQEVTQNYNALKSRFGLQ